MRIFDLAIILVMVGMAIAGPVALLSEVNQNYEMELSETDYAMFDQISNVESNVSIAVQRTFETEEGEKRDTDTSSGLIEAGAKSFKFLLNLPVMFYSLISDTFTVAGTQGGLSIPGAFQAGLFALVLVVIIFGAIAIVFKVRA